MNRLKNFTTETQYDIAKDNFVYTTVSYLEDVDEVRYMTQRDKYKREYLTFEALEDGVLNWGFTEWCHGSVVGTYIALSNDDGETWTTINPPTDTNSVDETLNVYEGDKIIVKGDLSIIGEYQEHLGLYFNSTSKFNVSGNILSISYGDNFFEQNYPQRYHFLFNGLNVISAKNLILPSNVNEYCYYQMFYNCTSLTTAPELPATTLANYCYGDMFGSCTSLTTAPALPATTLANSCYSGMFYGCTSLTTAPELPATTLMEGCYTNMFTNCTSLTTPPVLPATTLADYCYGNMFFGCTSLTTAPELPATTLAVRCYNGMFQNCTSLTTAPELPATTLAQSCYNSMFRGCSNLNYIKAMFTTTPSTSDTSNWVDGVAAIGTFIKNYKATWNVNGVNGVPNGWTVDIWDTNYDYFTTEAIDDSVFTFSIPSSISTSSLIYVEYSTDGGQTWVKTNNVNSTAVTVTTPTITAGNSVKWRCAASALATTSYRSTFSSSGRYNVSGNVMSLVGCASGFGSTYALSHLFYNSTNLVSAGNLSLPATRLADYCYRYMFWGCTSLTTVPELPATTLASNCYYYMFNGCTSLTTAPKLPATTLAQYCYQYMFQGCSSLTIAPALPATTLADTCYSSMFRNCAALTTVSELPATTLANRCYYSMFNNCTSLTTAPELPATTLADSCYGYMFSSCASLTNAPSILPPTTLRDRCYQSMFQSCTSLTTAPELPATTLANYCYQEMFSGCSNLNYIKAMFTTTPSASYTGSWVSSVAATGTFVKNPAATWNVTGNNGVPSGWVVERAWPDNIDYNYFTTEAIENSAFTLTIPSYLSTTYLENIEYSTNNGRTWVKTDNVNNQQVVITTPTITAGNSVKWRGIGTSLNGSNFSSSGRYNVSGNIMTLISNARTLSQTSTFEALFSGSTNLVSAENLTLPATRMTESCYLEMFYGCTSLTTAPELPATILASSCYNTMFDGCTSLTTAPELPAYTLVSGCYNDMFQNCSNLNYIKANFTTTPSDDYTNCWVNGVAATGTFVKSPEAEWNVTGVNGVPTGWTIEGQAIMKMWIDDFPEDEPGMYDGTPIEDMMDNAIEDPEGSGANAYVYCGDTMEYNGNEYYLWFELYGYGAPKYLLTTTDDFETLSEESMEVSGYDAEFTSLYARMDEDQTYVLIQETDQKLITVYEN